MLPRKRGRPPADGIGPNKASQLRQISRKQAQEREWEGKRDTLTEEACRYVREGPKRAASVCVSTEVQLHLDNLYMALQALQLSTLLAGIKSSGAS
jgi:hypothetical protein